jgi:hypothetical protein
MMTKLKRVYEKPEKKPTESAFLSTGSGPAV